MDAVTHTTYRRRDESRGGVGSTLTTWNPRGHEESACLRQSLVLVTMRQGNCDKVIAATEADMGAPPLSRVLPHPSPALECGLKSFGNLTATVLITDPACSGRLPKGPGCIKHKGASRPLGQGVGEGSEGRRAGRSLGHTDAVRL